MPFRFSHCLLVALFTCAGCDNRHPVESLVAPPTVDQQLASATQAIFASPAEPDNGIAAYLGELSRVFSSIEDPIEASAVARLAQVSSLGSAEILEAQRLASVASDGRVFSPLLLGPSSLSARLAQAQPLCPITSVEPTFVVYYVNGVLNTIDEALAALCALEFTVKRSRPEWADSDFRLFYNASGMMSDEDACAAASIKLSTDERLPEGIIASARAVAREYCNQRGWPADFGEAISQYLVRDWDGVVPDSVTSRLQELVGQDVLSGKRVVLIAHSQGNFFVRRVLRAWLGTPAPDGLSPLLDSISMIAIASPVDYEQDLQSALGEFRLLQARGDIILASPDAPESTLANCYSLSFDATSPPPRWLEDSLRDEVSLVLTGNLGAAALVAFLRRDSARAALDTHGLVESYLGCAVSKNLLLEAFDSARTELSNTRESAGQGQFQVTATWNVPGDLDLHVFEPLGTEVYFANRVGDVGELDRDDISGTGPENYFVCTTVTMPPGAYDVYMNNFSGAAGTTATITIRAGSQVKQYTRVMDAPNLGASLLFVARVTRLSDGKFLIEP